MSKRARNKSAEWSGWLSEMAFPAALGVLLALTLEKWGTPVIFDQMVSGPQTVGGWLYQRPWPMVWGYCLLGVVALLSWRIVRFQTPLPGWVHACALGWLGWQFVAATQTIAPQLTLATLKHFMACVLLFYLGAFAFARCRGHALFWLALLVGVLWVIWVGFDQHYGGLEAMRRYIYEETDWQELPSSFLYKIGSDRIFSTLVYPNALAGVILMLLPVSIWATWHLSGELAGLFEVPARSTRIPRLVVTGLVAYGGLGCLVWSGSKAGWLIALAILGFVFLHLPLKRGIKIGVAVGVVLVGLAGFGMKYADYFKEGAGSVKARLNYWEGGVEAFLDNPIVGTGPGTFAIAYKERKPEEAEMARLAHNDYLEQASDSGFIGFLAFLGWVIGSLAYLYWRCFCWQRPYFVATWLGLAAWALQGLVEFGLYIPALAWPAFLLLGWLWGDAESG